MGKKDDLMFHCFLAFVAGFLLSYFMNRSSNNVYDIYEGGPGADCPSTGTCWVGEVSLVDLNPSLISTDMFTLTLTERAPGYNLHVEPPASISFDCGWSPTCNLADTVKSQVEAFDFSVDGLGEPVTTQSVEWASFEGSMTVKVETNDNGSDMDVTLSGGGSGISISETTLTLSLQPIQLDEDCPATPFCSERGLIPKSSLVNGRPQNLSTIAQATFWRALRTDDTEEIAGWCCEGDPNQGSSDTNARNFKCPPSPFCSGRGLIPKSSLVDKRPATFEPTQNQVDFEDAITNSKTGIISEYCCSTSRTLIPRVDNPSPSSGGVPPALPSSGGNLVDDAGNMIDAASGGDVVAFGRAAASTDMDLIDTGMGLMGGLIGGH
jgi:hypothetical protein